MYFGCLSMGYALFNLSWSLPLSVPRTCPTLHIYITCWVPVGTSDAASGGNVQKRSGHICCPCAAFGWRPLAAADPCPRGRPGEAASPESSLLLGKVALRGGWWGESWREGGREGGTAAPPQTSEPVSSVPPASPCFSARECLLLPTALSTSSHI